MLLEKFCREKSIFYKKNELLKNYTTLKIGGEAKLVVFPDDENVIDLLKTIKEERLNFYIIGGGSNILARDEGFNGVIINTRKMQRILINESYIKVSAGTPLQRLIVFLAKRGLSGMEGLTGIPGTVGGAVKGNAGSFGSEIKDFIYEVEVITDEIRIKNLKRDEINFGYRSSNLPAKWFIREVKFLIEDFKLTENYIFSKMKEFLEKKRQSQPVREHSAGCVFKNPQQYPAGYLIEKAGFKGFRIGDIMVSHVHANYFINTGRGKASDFLKLMDVVKEKVFKLFNVELEPEIKILEEQK